VTPQTFPPRKTDWFAGPWELYRSLPPAQPAVLLESARLTPRTGRYSILGADPFLIFRYAHGCVSLSGPAAAPKAFATQDPWGVFRKLFRSFRNEASPDAPFAGGAIGYLGYEFKDHLGPRVSSRHRGELELPEMYFLFFDRAVVWDHREKTVLFCRTHVPGVAQSGPSAETWESACRGALTERRSRVSEVAAKRADGPMEIRFSMSAEEYEEAVRRAQAHIREGEIFQANLSHRLSFELPCTAREAYARLRDVNPSPFFGLLEAEDFQILSGSPERLLCLSGRSLETRPIAGTRKRGADAKKDEALSVELLLSEKERAEHVMLVDLERNDLGRVSEYGSVRVDELMALEHYSHVKHIVSNVRGVLREDLDALDALAAFFPGGTITGAPKIRCMQIIDEIETVPRGPYTGSLGYLSFAGDMDFNILIRSLAVKGGRAALNVGAGIVADSDPSKEYHETLYKAEAVLEAVFGKENVLAFFRERGLAARLS
jgi:anthranilate/para-aminobenzoate synthase component I